MGKNKVGKGGREFWVGWGKQVAILNRLICKGLAQKRAIKPKCERDEGPIYINMWEKRILG